MTGWLCGCLYTHSVLYCCAVVVKWTVRLLWRVDSNYFLLPCFPHRRRTHASSRLV